ncbi:MAG: outer membrane lipoprotein carrier protein LolA [Deltaproteobacteria bacterium]|nr:outer membrane lipoprotein carrier protein LolA [Deltaproteobacteria bacterium]
MLTLPLNATDTEAAFKWYADTTDCYQPHAGFQATFTHEFISVLDKRAAPMTGTISVSKTGLFSMRYATPSEKQAVFDGRKIRAWDSQSGLRISHTGKDNVLFTHLVTLFNASADELQRRFSARVIVARHGTATPSQYTVVELTPIQQSALVQKLVVTLGPCPAIRRVIVVDRAGNMIRLTFQNIALVDHFAKDTFQLQAPGNGPMVHP